ncbi:MAG: UDP-N-acetylmuramate dehydrogenase [Acidobacteria bacterium]|nr:UDP-N-acetylmuramate dehydrogenase [Acidobacteriota bacterium]
MKKPNFIQENVSLAPLTILRLGGAARFYADIADESALLEALAFAQTQSLALLILGGGSNLVIADTGFAGLALRIKPRGIHQQSDAVVTVAAGEPWDEFVAHCVAHNWAGIETLSGIPGLVGGTPIQNVGAYGQEVSATIQTVRAYDRVAQRFVHLSHAECGFAYRQSIFNTTARERYIVWSVTFGLRVNGTATWHYPDLQKRFTTQPSLHEVRAAVLDIRRRKGMVIDEADSDTRSAGSFFKNPSLSVDEFAALNERAANIPHYPNANQFKVPAAWLIEQAGFPKGFTAGRVAISTKHSLALVNRGGATTAELIALMRQIQDGVEKRFGVRLQPEPIFVG